MSEWISVENETPVRNQLVLAVGKKGGMFLGTAVDEALYNGALFMLVPNAGSRYATYWQPLPEAPK